MADNFQVTAGSGTTIATTEVSGAHEQKVRPTTLPPDASTETTLAAIKAKTDNLDIALSTLENVQVTNFPATQNVAVTSTVETEIKNDSGNPVPVNGTVSVGNFPATQPVSIAATVVTAEDRLTGVTPVMKTGTLVTTATTADQVILTYTVTAGKTFYFQYFRADVRLTATSATASILGTYSLESPAGTKLYTATNTNPTTSATNMNGFTTASPIPFAAGTVIRVVCTPAATTSMTWIANFGGYEK